MGRNLDLRQGYRAALQYRKDAPPTIGYVILRAPQQLPEHLCPPPLRQARVGEPA